MIPLPQLIGAGRLTVDENCGNSVLYVEENNTKKEAKEQWTDAARANGVKADFVATARGVVKIRDGCTCSVSCTGGDDYKIRCYCKLLGPSLLSDKELARGKLVTNPKTVDEWRWVDSRDHYSDPYTDVGTDEFIID